MKSPAAILGALAIIAASVASLSPAPSHAAPAILVPMDLTQADHLKAYGLAYYALTQGVTVEWLLNYRSGSFLIPDAEFIVRKARLFGVTIDTASDADQDAIRATIEGANMEIVRLEKAPRVAIYTPPNKQPWDDAVTLALAYAEIPHTTLWDKDVLAGDLSEYDWLHLHHEDFTGQYGKFYSSFRSEEWYQKEVALYEHLAREAGFAKVSRHKHAVVSAVKQYVAKGGFLFAMCSATDTYEIALAAENTDICESMMDGDPAARDAQTRLDFSNTLAFQDFTLEMNPMVYEFSDIDVSDYLGASTPEDDDFTLFDFSAKYDPIPSMLTQDHTAVVPGFLGQTTAFRRRVIKPSVLILGEKEGTDEVKYIHGKFGQGTFTFLGGHDPEDYQHAVGDPPTDLSLHKNSPGYRLILNNILFPAAKKQERKT
ncbi:MAG: asparagine synthetase B [bacterium]